MARVNGLKNLSQSRSAEACYGVGTIAKGIAEFSGGGTPPPG